MGACSPPVEVGLWRDWNPRLRASSANSPLHARVQDCKISMKLPEA